jgi:hypothetical protein
MCNAHYTRKWRGKDDGSPIGYRNHGGKKLPEYHSWNMMRARCNIPGTTGYEYYGGKGIIVCDQWNKFQNFIKDMGFRPTPLHTLDRKDVKGNYEPSNCVWATRKEQSRKRKYCKLSIEKAKEAKLEYYSTNISYKKLAKKYGVGASTIRSAIKGETWK